MVSQQVHWTQAAAQLMHGASDSAAVAGPYETADSMDSVLSWQASGSWSSFSKSVCPVVQCMGLGIRQQAACCMHMNIRQPLLHADVWSELVAVACLVHCRHWTAGWCSCKPQQPAASVTQQERKQEPRRRSISTTSTAQAHNAPVQQAVSSCDSWCSCCASVRG